MRKFKRKKGPVRSKKVMVDGIQFASGLEAYMYKALKKAKIKAGYEKRSFKIWQGCWFPAKAYERQANGKGDFKDRGNKNLLGISYTPDFEGKDFIIECKGRPNETFPLRWKMFKKYCRENLNNYTLYKPQRQSECDIVVKLIKNKHKWQER